MFSFVFRFLESDADDCISGIAVYIAGLVTTLAVINGLAVCLTISAVLAANLAVEGYVNLLTCS